MMSFTQHPCRIWDIFCTVVDNYGDIGVCWRLAVNLAQRGQRVRLWVDDLTPLQWLAPQGYPGVDVLDWHRPLKDVDLSEEPAHVLIEAFGCTLDIAVQSRWAQQHNTHAGIWLNLEYLTAQTYVQRFHLLPSPVLSGPAVGCIKYFFYPGFTSGTGGLLREPDLLLRQQFFNREGWLEQWGVPAHAYVVSLFCYEPQALMQLLQTYKETYQKSTHMLIAPGRPLQAVLMLLPEDVGQTLLMRKQVQWGALTLHALPWLEQREFDSLLWAADFNFVRGEDSLVRALWAGKPFAWQIYPQDDQAHYVKIQSFLDWIHAPVDMRRFHEVWNGMLQAELPIIVTEQQQQVWETCVMAAREHLLQQPDLVSQLLTLSLSELK